MGTNTDGVDVAVIGAGIVGAACAYYAARAGLSVAVFDRGAIAGGTSSAGEGNVLVSDKAPGPELALALLSARLWRELAEAPLRGRPAGEIFEFDPKGGLMVAASPAELAGLDALASGQREAGVESRSATGTELPEFEPNLATDLAGGQFYPQDAQVQPMLATAVLLRLARDLGARVYADEPVLALLGGEGRVGGVRTPHRSQPAGSVVNAAGAWAGEIAGLAGVELPIAPRRGYVLVTEPLEQVVRHKVYLADYVSDVASDEASLRFSPVVEGTASGTVLIGATRERVGFSRAWSGDAVRELARGAARLFPFLTDVAVLRAYHGFRPYCPDHLPVIGPDPRVSGLWHACGHEGAGVGLSAATGHLIVQSLLAERPTIELAPFRPDRFEAAA